MATSTPRTKRVVEECGLAHDSKEAAFMRKLEKENNRLQGQVGIMERDMGKMRQQLEPAAANRRFMQIARPARTCLNLIKAHIG